MKKDDKTIRVPQEDAIILQKALVHGMMALTQVEQQEINGLETLNSIYWMGRILLGIDKDQ